MINQPSPPDRFPHHHNLILQEQAPPSWLKLSPVGPLIYTDQLLAYCIKSALIYTDHPWPGAIYTAPGVHHLISQLRSVPQGLRHMLGQFSWCVDIILYGIVVNVQLGFRHTLKQFSHILHTLSVEIQWIAQDLELWLIQVRGWRDTVLIALLRTIMGGDHRELSSGGGLSAHHYKPALHWGVAITAIITIPIITSLPTTPGVRAKKIKRAIWSK